MRAPYPPPFRVGDRVAYQGPSWGHYRDPSDASTILWIHDGAAGSVIRNTAGSAALPGEPYPSDGWSTLRFDVDPEGLCDRALSFEEDDDGRRQPPSRYAKVRASRYAKVRA